MSWPTDELRAWVAAVREFHGTDAHGKRREYVDVTTRELLGIADRIDAECERRMADMAEVVRCADCESAMESHYYGCLVCCRHGIHVDGSHFCSDGERRGEDA